MDAHEEAAKVFLYDLHQQFRSVMESQVSVSKFQTWMPGCIRCIDFLCPSGNAACAARSAAYKVGSFQDNSESRGTDDSKICLGEGSRRHIERTCSGEST